jgi:glycosyltransferase involved in cell wall biosynthesis
MRILIIHNKYGALGGEDTMVERISGLLRDNGHEVDFWLEEGVPLHAGLRLKARAFVRGIYSLDSARKVRQRISSFRPDIVQVQNVYPMLSPSVLPAIRRLGFPVVMRCSNYRLVCPSGLFLSHGQVCERCLGGREYWCVLRNCENSIPKSVGYSVRNFAARILRLFEANVTMFYAQTEFQKKKLVEGGIPAERIDTIPNMVEIPECPNGAVAGGYVGFSGRLSPEKGIKTLLDAAKNCRQIPFRLAGHFGRMPDAEKDKPANVELLGYLDESRLDRFYRDSRICVTPSVWYEGFPGVIIEAMLRAKPVICSRIGGMPEIVDDGVTGLLFNPGDSKDLAAKIEWLWTHPDLCIEMGRAGREKAVREYSPARYYERLMNTYSRALKRAGFTIVKERSGVEAPECGFE